MHVQSELLCNAIETIIKIIRKVAETVTNYNIMGIITLYWKIIMEITS